MAELKLKGINKIYPNGFHAVKGVDLDIEDKEFMVLVGPSGCGKTTTLRMIAGLEEISEGDMSIGDRIVNDIAPKDRDIAMVFQNYALYPHMTVYENMAFGLKLRKQPKAEIKERVTNAANVLGIESLLDRKPKQLSGGQRQRVALGRAIVRNPKVFLMDEPLSNLDAKLRVQMRAELIKLHQELATTFVYVTHDQTEAMTMGTRICVMNNGFIQQVADPTTIYNHPANKFVAGFIGAPQMNFIDVKCTVEDGGLFATFGNSKVEITGGIKEKLDVPSLHNRELSLGVRPEDIIVVEENDANAVPAIVEVRELLGSETFLYINIEGKSYNARVSPDLHLNIGDAIHVKFNNTKLHLFDKETENSLLY